MRNSVKTPTNFKHTRLAALLPALFAGCGGGGESSIPGLLAGDPIAELVSDVQVRVDLPRRITSLNEAVVVQVTVSGQTSELSASSDTENRGSYELPFNVEHIIHLSIRRQSDNLILGTAQQHFTSGSDLQIYFPEKNTKGSKNTMGSNREFKS